MVLLWNPLKGISYKSVIGSNLVPNILVKYDIGQFQLLGAEGLVIRGSGMTWVIVEVLRME